MADGIDSLSAPEIEAMSKTLHEKLLVHPISSHAGEPLQGINITTTTYNTALDIQDHQFHVVMVPYPVQGHINPMMQFAKVLVSRYGVRVTFINTKHNHDRIQQARSTSSTTSSSPSSDMSKLQFLWIDNGMPCDFDYTDLTPTRFREFHLAVCNMKDPLKELLQSFNQKTSPVSCVLFGSFCPWAHNVASELGIPSIFFWTQSTSVFSIYYHAPLLATNGFFPFNKKALPAGCNGDEAKPHKLASHRVSYIPGVPPLHPLSFPTLLHIDSMSDSGFQLFKEQFGILPDCAGVIVNSFEELEMDAYQALQSALPFPVALVGPLIPSAFLEAGDMNDTSVGASLLQEKNECIQWLDSQKNQSVLYVSFGSLFNPSNEDVESIANGIRASKQPFLWVIRSKPSLHTSIVADMGFMEDTKEYGLIIPWAPQLQVLSHPSVGAFLTHCGWNSTLESVSMGMPMIPFPIISDQPTNCTFVCDVWKIGMALKRQDDGLVNSMDVERAIRTALNEQEGKEMRERAGELREAARRAVLRPQGSSHIQMDKFFEAMRNQSVRTVSST